ncbi:iron-containing alcohol dehydrogenase [Prauserella halophila]|uniref:Iron-containing alcohol dehydrogenase n=1 Tax=Prauserella halophila TaxID=185641 RepID=A0ABP4GRX6_9PSEU|nr:iron-containing alcohol dehydrogenase [Prauserella halophila]MCP2235805.1 alcohol dehydrogenase [Prauserella halophila]
MTTTLAFPRLTRLGAGAVDELPAVLRDLGLQRPVLVTDKFLASTGDADRLCSLLAKDGIEALLFADTVPDPTTDSLTAGLRAAASHQADCVVGFGGGSPIDTAKALAVLAVNGGVMSDYKAPHVYAGPALPIIAIPTTAGSGSEATQFTVISDSLTDEKMLCPGSSFLPVAAIVDHELTTSMPARLTADTGIDALTHAIEAYVSRKSNHVSDALALSAIRTIAGNIEDAYRDGENAPAREAMMVASTEAGMAFSNASVALVHGMSRPIGAHFHVAHGLSNAMLLPAVTRYSVPGAVERYANCSRAFGSGSESDSDSVAADKLIAELERLCAELGVPTPGSYGIEKDRWSELVPTMAVQAIASGSPANNPVVPDAGEIEALYHEIFER